MVNILQYEFYLTILIDAISRFLPIRELFNVIQIAITSTHQRFVTLTAKHWYMLIFIILLFFSSILVMLVYFQNYYKYSILKHIKLRHNWILYETPEYPKYCTYCTGIIRKRFLLMRNYEGWQCLICKRISHMHCIMQSDSQYCKVECSLNYNFRNDSEPLNDFVNLSQSKNDKNQVKIHENLHFHVLIKGNLQSGAICSICRTVCFSPFGLHGQRCIWCNRVFHDECALNRKIEEQICDLGTLKYIILPPNCFKIELIKTNKKYDSIENKLAFLDKDLKKNFTHDNAILENSRTQLEFTESKSKFDKIKSRISTHRRISELIQIFPKSRTFKKKLKLNNEFFATKTGKPILVFVNVKSGGHLGQELIKDLYMYLNPIQIVDIQNSKGPDEALLLFKQLADINRLLILVCGGDGTVRWVLDRSREIYGTNSEKLPPIAVLPLGTGNDLSRILGWDVSFNGDILGFLKKICTSNVKQMDIWTCSAWEIGNQDKTNNIGKKLLFSSTFLNYLDIGIAARIALRFHNLREAYPQHFNSRLGNQLVYGEVGLRDFLASKSIQLDGLKIWCDGEEVNISNQIGNIQIANNENLFNFKYNKSSSFEKVDIKSYIRYFIGNQIGYFICKYLHYVFSFLFYFFGLCKDINSEIEKGEFLENQNNNFCSKEQKLEGLIICNIPSFAGGINLWKISNYAHECNKTECKSHNSLPTKDVLSNKNANRSSGERSMSFAVENIRNSNYISYSHSDLSDNDEINHFETNFANERRKSTSTLKHWFSDVFKKNLPIISYSEDSRNDYQEESLINKFKLQKIDDGLIEVCGIRSLLHLTQLQVGLTEPIKLCQGSHIVVDIPRQIPFQVDGEPRIINKCRLIIESSGKIPVLCPENIENAIPLSVKNALELAVQKNVVDNKQRIWITKQIIKENRILIS